MELESRLSLNPVSTTLKPRKHRGTLTDWAGLLKSIIWGKLFWGPEVPNAETEAALLRAEEDYRSGRTMSFDSIDDAIVWAEKNSI